ncbi:hypothetical protein LTR37_002185 [Vermiconidia calcicola]|uniref:Uncharacterized protein n=1 Tax=Vermiconidia calcicola TaxID=1690605 RepID=A0ACC3NTT9_9PEZI|nr:hypothetical protein LTR37_002185 [Vermiconidia calcicola]
MRILARLWTTVTYVVSWLSPSSVDSAGVDRIPLASELGIDSAISIFKGPGFKPPSGRPAGPGSDFGCDYSNMPGWEPCFTPDDRGCWLKNRHGEEYNITTDYENNKPNGVDRYYYLTVDDGQWNADGINFDEAQLFNNTFPGPWIQACWGDNVHIKVTNKLKNNGTSIHWHGIRQLNTTQMHGVNGVTQCPIASDDSFWYNWTTWQYGSSWYHSHYSVQYNNGLQGPITIHGPASAPFDEAKLPMLMTDWGHNSAFEAVKTRDLGNPSILLNGTGNVTRFSGGEYTNTSTIPPIYQAHFDRPKGLGRPKRYLLRLINTSFDTTFIFSIDNHLIQIISADFVPVSPVFVQSLLIGIGQRYNVIVDAQPDTGPNNPRTKDGNYWIRTFVADNNCGEIGATGYEQTGILRYDKTSATDPTSQAWPNIDKHCSDALYDLPNSGLKPVLPWQVGKPKNGAGNGEQFDVNSLFVPPKPAGFPLAIFSLQRHSEQGFKPLQIDYSDPIFLQLDNSTDAWPERWVVIPENYTSTDWVYLIIGSSVGRPSTFGFHPIHLHGHDFAILQQEENTVVSHAVFKPNTDNPLRRDVVQLPVNGFVVIGFKADNPGSWLMHCHLAFHAAGGLALQTLERQADANKLFPHSTSEAIEEAERVCKNWVKWWNPLVNPEDDSGI